MLIVHRGKKPLIHPSAYIAPNAVISGDVTVGANCRILFGAVLTSEGGAIEIGTHCIVMENAVLRGTARNPLRLGDNVLVGPRAYLSGCTVENNVFLAAGSTVFNGAWIGARSEVRINGVVHLRTVLPPETTVPIGWVAVGDPPLVRPPDAHDEIWAAQKELDFPGYVFGLEAASPGETIMPELTRRYAQALAAHKDDTLADS